MQRIIDVISGFEGFHVQPMREPKVKRYKVNPVPNDMNANRPIAMCLNDTHDLSKLKIIGHVPFYHLRINPKLDWRYFDYAGFVSENNGILKFVAKRKGMPSVTLKCVKN